MVKRQSIFTYMVAFVVLLIAPLYAEVTITPTNVQIPELAGENFSFDFAISDPCGVSARAFQSTIAVSGLGTLTFDSISSRALETEADYWLFGNCYGALIMDNLDGTYTFGDDPCNAIPQALAVGDLMARYTFEWDGTPGDYTFTIDLDTSESLIMGSSYNIQALAFDPGVYPGDASSFTVTMPIPEPATVLVLGFGAVVLRKRRVT
jgi:hypothetical protein